MDKKTWLQFRKDFSVEELEKRFAFEEERKAQCLSITNRDFYEKLNERLKKMPRNSIDCKRLGGENNG
jgi:hypothetical protein